MEFKVLGPLELRRDGRLIALPGGKPRVVVAVLLLHAGEPVSADRLSVALWGQDAPAGSVRTVQVYVSRLRRALGDADLLATSRAGYRLRVRPGELDLERFEHLVDAGRRALAARRPQDAGQLLRQALGLWRGPPLADLASEPFAHAEIARLEEQRLAAVETRIEADLAAGRHAELVAELQQLIDEHPLRERLHGQLMLSLYRTGRQAEALATYRAARDVLVDQLGLEPGPELRQLERAVLAHDPELMSEEGAAAGRRATPSREPTPTARMRVPLPATPTIGRDADLAELQAVVGASSVRLVTVVGPGGVGKTRVAIELARSVGIQFRDGAVFVSLAALAAAEHVASAIARDLCIAPAPEQPVEDALARQLAQRELLLVLDNFEHVLDAATLVADLLAVAPELKVLATSREPLRLRAERLFHLGPLAVTPEEGARAAAPAVRLLVATVQARDPMFALSERNLPAVAEVCRRLDGLPLAIELAAGRVGLLSLPELARRLRSGLDALGAAPRDAPSRQRTLNATLEWSYGLLDPEERRVLVALSVFAGGCTLDAALAATGAALDVVESLVAKNLVLAGAGHDGVGRLTMLETVQAFARALFDDSREAEAIARRHCGYYLELAERALPELEWTGSRTLLAELDRELDNMRAAFAWALEHAPELALRLATGAALYWHLSAVRSEAVDWLEAALATGEPIPVHVRADALRYYAINLAKPSTIEQAERAARESLELSRSANDPSLCARSTAALAHVLLQGHEPRDAYRYAGAALQLARTASDEQAHLWALRTMAMSAPTVCEALSLGEKAATVYRGAGNQRELAGLQTSLVYTALFLGDHAAAEPLSLEALDAARADGDPFVLALAHGNAGLAAIFNDRVGAAQDAFVNELRLSIGHGFDTGYGGLLFEAIDGLAAVAATQGHDRTAATLTGAAHAATGEHHDPVIARRIDERFFAPARRRLGDQAWNDAYAAGAAYDRDQAIDATLRSVELRVVA